MTMGLLRPSLCLNGKTFVSGLATLGKGTFLLQGQGGVIVLLESSKGMRQAKVCGQVPSELCRKKEQPYRSNGSTAKGRTALGFSTTRKHCHALYPGAFVNGQQG